MTTKQTRSFVSLTAALACVAAAAGCQPAHFISNPTTGAPVNTADKPTNNGGNTGGAATPAKDLSTFSGQAVIGGKPIANAKITLTDAITGKALNIVASGGGNLTTDAQGNFNVQAAGISPSQVVNMKISNATQGVSGLVRGTGAALGGSAAKKYKSNYKSSYKTHYRTVQAFSVSLTLNEVSTAVTKSMGPFFALLASIKSSDDLDKAIANLSATADSGPRTRLAEQLAKDPTLADKLCTGDDNSDSSSKDIIKGMLDDAKLTGTIATQIAQLAQENAAFRTALTSDSGDSEIAISVSISADGKLTIGDVTVTTTTENTTTDDNGNTTTTTTTTTDTLTPDIPDIELTCAEAIGSLTDSYTDKAHFNPQVTLTTGVANSLGVKVTQNSGESDIKHIFVKVPSSEVTFKAPTTTDGDGDQVLGSLTTTDVGVNNFDSTQTASATKTLSIYGDGADGDFWEGTIGTKDKTIDLGSVSVDVDNSPSGFTTLDISNTVFSSLTPTNFGHVTNFTTGSGVFTLKNCSKATITITGRNGESVTLERLLDYGGKAQ